MQTAVPFTHAALDAVRESRCASANELIEVVKSCGRHFFARSEGKGYDARLFIDSLGVIRFVDEYSGKEFDVLSDRLREIRKSSHGSGVRWFLRCLGEYVKDGIQVEDESIGIHWGYGADIDTVRQAAVRVGFAFPAERVSQSSSPHRVGVGR